MYFNNNTSQLDFISSEEILVDNLGTSLEHPFARAPLFKMNDFLPSYTIQSASFKVPHK